MNDELKRLLIAISIVIGAVLLMALLLWIGTELNTFCIETDCDLGLDL